MTEINNMSDINEIKIALSKIAKGKWVSKPREFAGGSCAIYLGEVDFDGFDHHKEENAEFIVNAPEWISSLITTIESQKEEIESKDNIFKGYKQQSELIENRLNSQVESLKAITELAVKGLEDIVDENIGFPRLIARETLSEIERLPQ